MTCQQRMASQEQEIIRLTKKLQSMQQELLHTLSKCEQLTSQLYQAQSQLSQSVPKDEFDRVRHSSE